MRYVVLGRDNLRSHFVFRPCHAPEWLRARFLPVVFLANEEELTGKTFTTSLNTTNPNTYMKFMFLWTSALKIAHKASTKNFLFPVSRPTHFLEKIEIFFCPTNLLYSSKLPFPLLLQSWACAHRPLTRAFISTNLKLATGDTWTR